MFDFACIIIALYVCYKTNNNNRDVSFILMSWFVVSEVVFTLWSDIWPDAEGYQIHIIYNVINILSIAALVSLNAHICILLVFASNLLLNTISTIYHEYHFISELVYNMFYYEAVAISFLVLFYMISISKKGSLFEFIDSHNSVLISVLRCRYVDFIRLYSRGAP